MWVEWLWTALFLALTGHCVARLVLASRAGRPVGERAGDATHALMSLGMAAMFSPVGGPIPRAGWLAVFGLITGYCAVAAWRAGRRPARLCWGKHLIAGLAMIYMLIAWPVALAAWDIGHGGHGGRSGHSGGSGVPALTWLLAGYFALYALWSVSDAVGLRSPAGALAGGPGARAAPPRLLAPRVVASCEVVMATGMVYMLVALH